LDLLVRLAVSVVQLVLIAAGRLLVNR